MGILPNPKFKFGAGMFITGAGTLGNIIFRSTIGVPGGGGTIAGVTAGATGTLSVPIGLTGRGFMPRLPPMSDAASDPPRVGVSSTIGITAAGGT